MKNEADITVAIICFENKSDRSNNNPIEIKPIRQHIINEIIVIFLDIAKPHKIFLKEILEFLL